MDKRFDLREEVCTADVRKAAEAIYREDHRDWLATGHELPPLSDMAESHQRRYERFARAAIVAFLDALAVEDYAQATALGNRLVDEPTMPRWDQDKLVLERGWDTHDRCGNCGELNPAVPPKGAE